MSELIELAYISKAAHLFSSKDLLELLNQSRIKNEILGITGMLLYKDLSFLQILEGERDTIETVFEVIKQDIRHSQVKLLFNKPLVKRHFTEWSMGFACLDDIDTSQLKGFSSLFDEQADLMQLFSQPILAYRLLLEFRKKS